MMKSKFWAIFLLLGAFLSGCNQEEVSEEDLINYYEKSSNSEQQSCLSGQVRIALCEIKSDGKIIGHGQVNQLCSQELWSDVSECLPIRCSEGYQIAGGKCEVVTMPGKTIDLSLITVSSNSTELSSSGELTLDNNFNQDSAWSSSSSEQYIQFHLGNSYELTSVQLAFGSTSEISIFTSLDGENFDLAFSGMTAGESGEFENFDLPLMVAKIVRIEGVSVLSHENFSLREIRFNVPELAQDNSCADGEVRQEAGLNGTFLNYACEGNHWVSVGTTCQDSLLTYSESLCKEVTSVALQ